ncbi:MAG: TRAP transporter small permease [Xanthobacteraceae bacterium]
MGGGLTGRIGRWNGRATLWLARIAAAVLALLAVVTFCDVIARYFFNSPFSFTVEITEIAMGVIVYFGVGLVTQDNGHISVDIVTLRLSERRRALLGLVTNVAALGFLAVMVWRLWLRTVVLFDKGDVSPIMLIPRWPTALLMTVGAVFFLTGLVVHIVTDYARVRSDQAPPRSPSAPRPYTD